MLKLFPESGAEPQMQGDMKIIIVPDSAVSSFAYSAKHLEELLRFTSQNAARRSTAVYVMPRDIIWGGSSSEWIPDIKLKTLQQAAGNLLR
jgi:hypothetical protein